MSHEAPAHTYSRRPKFILWFTWKIAQENPLRNLPFLFEGGCHRNVVTIRT